jgi:hypothetical protein
MAEHELTLHHEMVVVVVQVRKSVAYYAAASLVSFLGW